MSQATFSIRMDKALKKDFDELCTHFGMNATTAFNIFARAVVREKRIPFEIAIHEKSTNTQAGKDAFLALRQEAKENGLDGLTLEEINQEVKLVRKERG